MDINGRSIALYQSLLLRGRPPMGLFVVYLLEYDGLYQIYYYNHVLFEVLNL